VFMGEQELARAMAGEVLSMLEVKTGIRTAVSR
jgi:hypothetical protein